MADATAGKEPATRWVAYDGGEGGRADRIELRDLYRTIGRDVALIAISHHRASTADMPIARMIRHGIDVGAVPLGGGGSRTVGERGAITMTDMTEKAILAGGCFWGMQDLIRKRPGVVSTRVGYTGGDVPNATYRNHGTHAEAIEITFDPGKTSYRDLLEFFFQIHDPTTKNRQGNDIGMSYRSAIFYTDDEQKRVAEDTIADVDASGLWPGKVVTEVSPAGPFWEAEPEHQDYLERFPQGYTCHYPRPDWKLPRRENAG